jgi:putative DNA primase/helicase
VTSAWDELWAEAKRADMVELARRLGARLKREGPGWIGPRPRGCASQDGVIVNQKRGFLCRPSGARGDAVDMVEHVHGVSKTEALEFITGKPSTITGKPLPGKDAKPAPPPAEEGPAREARQDGLNGVTTTTITTTADALVLWHQGVDPRGTRGERYLKDERKLDLGADLAGEVLRWHPGVGAILTLYRNILTGEPQAVQRTLLDQDARKIGRKFLGPVGGAAVMLDPEVLAGLHIGEGIETCLAARQFDLRPTWALGSTTAIANFPVLSGVECLTLMQENDANGASQRACEACALRWHAAGREVIVNTSNYGNDLNDALRGLRP